MSGLLDKEVFQTIVKNAPLVSIDLCLIFNGHILLGKRSNEPLKNQWFTPGGRILKNESKQEALQRLAFKELGLHIENLGTFELMGVWDHFYHNSYFDEGVSTHYINLPHFTRLNHKPIITMDEQHKELSWFKLKNVADSDVFNTYMRNYANFLIKHTE